jgi:hypothetical protein
VLAFLTSLQYLVRELLSLTPHFQTPVPMPTHFHSNQPPFFPFRRQDAQPALPVLAGQLARQLALLLQTQGSRHSPDREVDVCFFTLYNSQFGNALRRTASIFMSVSLMVFSKNRFFE